MMAWLTWPSMCSTPSAILFAWSATLHALDDEPVVEAVPPVLQLYLPQDEVVLDRHVELPDCVETEPVDLVVGLCHGARGVHVELDERAYGVAVHGLGYQEHPLQDVLDAQLGVAQQDLERYPLPRVRDYLGPDEVPARSLLDRVPLGRGEQSLLGLHVDRAVAEEVDRDKPPHYGVGLVLRGDLNPGLGLCRRDLADPRGDHERGVSLLLHRDRVPGVEAHLLHPLLGQGEHVRRLS